MMIDPVLGGLALIIFAGLAGFGVLAWGMSKIVEAENKGEKK